MTTWTPLPVPAATTFWARRFAHETLMHRADAALALGVPFTVDQAVLAWRRAQRRRRWRYAGR